MLQFQSVGIQEMELKQRNYYKIIVLKKIAVTIKSLVSVIYGRNIKKVTIACLIFLPLTLEGYLHSSISVSYTPSIFC